MSRFKIYTADGEVFFAERMSYVRQGSSASEDGILVLAFVAKNGPDQGHRHLVPVGRVTRIIDTKED